MGAYEVLWFLAGWIAAAITPLITEMARFGAIIIKNAGRRRQMIAYAKLKVNGRFNGLGDRQGEIRSILGGADSDNGKNQDRT